MLFSARASITAINQLTKLIPTVMPGSGNLLRRQNILWRTDSGSKCSSIRIFFAFPLIIFEAWSSHSHLSLQSVYMNWHHHQSLFHQRFIQIMFVWAAFFWTAFLKKYVRVWGRESKAICVCSHWNTHSMLSKFTFRSECAVDGHQCPSVESTKDTEERLTAAAH